MTPNEAIQRAEAMLALAFPSDRPLNNANDPLVLIEGAKAYMDLAFLKKVRNDRRNSDSWKEE